METNMDQGIKESIQIFEHKKEFREVKLKTRQSFREDQAALERRLSKRTDGRKSVKRMSKGETNGETETNENGVLSKLESIVLDIGIEKEKERNSSTDTVTVTDGEDNRSRKDSLDDNIFLEEGSENVEKASGAKQQAGLTNGTTGTQKVPRQNGLILHQVKQNLNGSAVPYGLVPNGHTVVQNGQTSTSGPATLLVRPKVNVQARVAMTPEPRLKSLKGIYQKNPKLTATSTDHLDNVSLMGVKPAGVTQGQKTEYQQVMVPAIPGAEVTSIPGDGNLSEFSVEQMVTVFRLLRLPEELVYRLCKYKVDGKRFAVFTDTELRDLGMSNPIIRYFRDRTAQKPRKKQPKFML